MTIIRSYFSKNNCLIGGNYTNNGNNPVVEISTVDDNQLNQSRCIFDIDLNRLTEKKNSGILNQNNTKHYLVMTNTIHYSPDKKYSNSFNGAERASSFSLDLYNVNEDWDGGNGYDIIYNSFVPNLTTSSNWFFRLEDNTWETEGGDVNEIISSQSFDNGNENIKIDITDYINQRLFVSGYTGTTVYSGSTYGLGLKFKTPSELTNSNVRKFVAFHGKNTNTYYEPFIETVISNEIYDNRDFFQLDTDNSLYLYLNNIKNTDVVSVNSVNIVDYTGVIFSNISDIIKVKDGLYKININIGSNSYPDCIMFNDDWNVNVNGKDVKYSNEFYIQPNEYMSLFSDINDANIKNYYFSLIGINENEQIIAGENKKIRISVRSVYESKLLTNKLKVEYKIYTKVGKDFEIIIISYSLFNKTIYGYEFDLDTSWLIPQDYFIEIKLTYNEQSIKNKLSFTVLQNLSN